MADIEQMVRIIGHL